MLPWLPPLSGTGGGDSLLAMLRALWDQGALLVGVESADSGALPGRPAGWSSCWVAGHGCSSLCTAGLPAARW